MHVVASGSGSDDDGLMDLFISLTAVLAGRCPLGARDDTTTTCSGGPAGRPAVDSLVHGRLAGVVRRRCGGSDGRRGSRLMTTTCPVQLPDTARHACTRLVKCACACRARHTASHERTCATPFHAVGPDVVQIVQLQIVLLQIVQLLGLLMSIIFSCKFYSCLCLP